MSKYDMLVICGLPRSGTTFLNDLFSIGAFGLNYYGTHSKKLGGIGYHPLHLCESQFMGIMFRNNVRLDGPMRLLCNFWKNEINDYEKIIVYKHPQIILQAPFNEHTGFQIKYIFCTRDFVSWRESFIRINGHMGIHKDAVDSHYNKYWEGGIWQTPESLDTRMEILYSMFKKKIDNPPPNTHIFNYNTDRDTFVSELACLINIFDKTISKNNIRIRAEQLIDRHWRASKS